LVRAIALLVPLSDKSYEKKGSDFFWVIFELGLTPIEE
jgi:hypothetical protein